MKILIIGSKGFIGSHLVNFFSRAEHDVWACDVVVDYVNSKYFQVDATNADYLKLFEEQKFDVCVNCSGAASVPESLIHPLRDFILNTSHVFSMLNAIHRHNKDCKYINLSSAAVYGNPIQLPIVEVAKLDPISPYGKHKLMAEMICREFYTDFNIQTCSLRIFSAYGNGLRKQLFWDLAQKMSKTNKLDLFGSGNETRDFIHVEDIARVLDLVIKQSKFEGECINVANGIEVSIKDVVSSFSQEFEWEGMIVFLGNERAGDPINWCADVSVIRSMGYTPSVTLENGLNQYSKWYKENN